MCARTGTRKTIVSNNAEIAKAEVETLLLRLTHSFSHLLAAVVHLPSREDVVCTTLMPWKGRGQQGWCTLCSPRPLVVEALPDKNSSAFARIWCKIGCSSAGDYGPTFGLAVCSGLCLVGWACENSEKIAQARQRPCSPTRQRLRHQNTAHPVPSSVICLQQVQLQFGGQN